MKIGIDVGGTYTDAVLVEGSRMIKWAKVPTRHDHLLESIEGALDQLLINTDSSSVSRVTISTTIITNLVVEEKYDPVGLVLIPGPGYNPKAWNISPHTVILKGAVDFRGKLIQDIDAAEVIKAVEELASKNLAKVVVVGKFSIRNPILEEKVKEIILQQKPHWEVSLGHSTGGHLNFPRRAATALLTAATIDKYARFAQEVAQAVTVRKITAPIYVLKADGGTVPLEKSIKHPVETIFSGPAASVLGALAMSKDRETGVVVDMGGTTTDLALILSGHPLLASHGAVVGHYKTQIRAFNVTSVPLGGDSTVNVQEGELVIEPRRKGPAACLGGPGPTPTDSFRVLGLTEIGDYDLAYASMTKIGKQLGVSPEVAAEEIAHLVTNQIIQAIERIFRDWQEEPAYRLWELLHKGVERPRNIIGVGGASSIVERVAAAMDCKCYLPGSGRVANAVGAALAKPSVVVTLRADTQRAFYNVEEEGLQLNIDHPQQFKKENALLIADEWLVKRGQALGIEVDLGEREIISQEVFNIVRNSQRVGRIIDISIQTPWKIEGLLDSHDSVGAIAAGGGVDKHE